MKNSNFTRDQFAKFLFSQNRKIKNYNFDLLHDIKQIMNFAYNRENTADENGQTITNRPIEKSFFFFVRESGTWLVDEENTETLQSIEKSFNHIEKFKITIIANCDYFYKTPFAKVQKLTN